MNVAVASKTFSGVTAAGAATLDRWGRTTISRRAYRRARMALEMITLMLLGTSLTMAVSSSLLLVGSSAALMVRMGQLGLL